MTTGSPESLRQLLANLHAERLATWKPEDLQLNIEQRRILVDAADPARFIKVGDHVAPFSLAEVDGGTVVLEDLVSNGPAVLIFFRFAGCPACNIALPYYQRQLYPGLAALGIPLVAISPQVPERLVEIKRRHSLPFLVAADLQNELGRRFGILFTASEASQAAARAKGSFIGDVTGTGSWELPQPAVIVIDRDQIVRFAEVSPDWLVRTEAEPVLDIVRGLTRAVAAE